VGSGDLVGPNTRVEALAASAARPSLIRHGNSISCSRFSCGHASTLRTSGRERDMNSTFRRIGATGALLGALAIASAAPTQAAEGRNAAFAAGVAAGALGGAALGGGYAPYPAYGGYPAYGYGPGYYPRPRYVRPYRRHYHYYH
jgi:hypothetical protein